MARLLRFQPRMPRIHPLRLERGEETGEVSNRCDFLPQKNAKGLTRPSRNQSSADFPVCCIAGFPTREPREVTRPADWEIGATPAATAGCATEKASQIATKFGDSTAKKLLLLRI
jgi:hypothetical protein